MNNDAEYPALSAIQHRRMVTLWAAVALVGCLLPFVQPMAPVEGLLHETFETLGLVLIGVAVLGRAWCTLYIGGRKARELVDKGPYSISRNPLYMFSFIGILGVGAQTGSWVFGLLLALGSLAIFLPVILNEEKVLGRLFPEAFEAYKLHVPRFGPSFYSWKGVETLVVQPTLLWRTIRDGLTFFLVVPLIEILNWFHGLGVVDPLIRLP